MQGLSTALDAGQSGFNAFLNQFDYRYLIDGSSENSFYLGGARANTIIAERPDGFGGATIISLGRRDNIDPSRLNASIYVESGAGNDTVRTGYSTDQIRGQGGRDTLRGGRGSDNIKGQSGNDRVFGQGGDDEYLTGGRGNDLVRGGGGNDYITDGSGQNRLFGDAGDDLIYGRGILHGGTGND